MSESVYLDNHSATRPFMEVLDVAKRASKEYWGASFSSHFVGQQQLYPLEKSRAGLLAALGAAQGDSLFLNSGSAEATYHVLLNAYLQITRETGKTLFLTGSIEEVSTGLSFKQMESLGCVVKEIAVNSKGQITKQALAKAITPKTAVFSISWANGLTGVIQPVHDLAELCREKNVLFHLDASYVMGKLFFRFEDLNLDFMSLDGSLIHGLQGTGLAVVKKGTPIHPLIPGKIQDPVFEVSSLAYAVSEIQEKFECYSMEIARLRDLLEASVLSAFPDAVIICKEADRLPNCSAIAFPGVYAEALLYLLNAKGIYASIGGGKFQSLERILLLMGNPPHIAGSAVSFSLAWDSTEEEVVQTVEAIVSSVNQLKECSKGVLS